MDEGEVCQHSHGIDVWQMRLQSTGVQQVPQVPQRKHLGWTFFATPGAGARLVHQKWHDISLTLLALGISNVEHKANIIV